MKNLFIAICAVFICCSCSVTNYLVADISLMDLNGDLISKWDNAVMQTFENNVSTFGGIKTGGGINFVDTNDISHYINGGIIHANNIRSLTKEEYISCKIEPLIKKYNILKMIYEKDQTDIMTTDKDSELYSVIMERIEHTSKSIKDISEQLIKYGYKIN